MNALSVPLPLTKKNPDVVFSRSFSKGSDTTVARPTILPTTSPGVPPRSREAEKSSLASGATVTSHLAAMKRKNQPRQAGPRNHRGDCHRRHPAGSKTFSEARQDFHQGPSRNHRDFRPGPSRNRRDSLPQGSNRRHRDFSPLPPHSVRVAVAVKAAAAGSTRRFCLPPDRGVRCPITTTGTCWS